jgi:putative selenate reductase
VAADGVPLSAELRPQPIERLLERALAELETRRSIFDLPRRSFWAGRDGLDLSVAVHGERAATPLGPAAGPHTQLAHNLVIAWLAGARVLELKTVQARDRLTIPRPCIDAATVGYNVEWSQELRLEESLEQYVTAWALIHMLAARDVNRAGPARQAAVFDASVGYDLAGIRTDPVARFLDRILDCGEVLNRLRERLPASLRPAADVPVPRRMCSGVTLSTFHGCPPEEIERIVEHLFARHGVHVVVKFNPTLLGYDAVDELLRGRLGYDEIELDRAAFARDLQWDDALAMMDRLAAVATRHGCGCRARRCICRERRST